VIDKNLKKASTDIENSKGEQQRACTTSYEIKKLVGQRRCSEDRFKPKLQYGNMTPLLGT
jgi:hypothetical protein